MPKYYCDYCKSYLTHDTMSVRKSHLMGKNHIKYYCNYYELKAKETGQWNPTELMYEINLTYLNHNAPGSQHTNYKYRNQNTITNVDDITTKESSDVGANDDEEEFLLPPPPNLAGFPLPPPSVFHNTREYQRAISKHT
ncbi:U1 small nuclear ribonucleoprotein C [Spathaspora sp. JA1]|nr:U1 small nuclear ribonucleoprotein C [Spathaspora sp. JA1]